MIEYSSRSDMKYISGNLTTVQVETYFLNSALTGIGTLSTKRKYTPDDKPDDAQDYLPSRKELI